MENVRVSVASLQLRRKNKAGRMTLRYVWDVVGREDSPLRLLVETWGGKPDGYIKCFDTDLILGNYLSGRIAKASVGASDHEVSLDIVGDTDFVVSGDKHRLEAALHSENHENAKLRLKISGANVDWDENSCLNHTLSGIVGFGDIAETNEFTQALASRIRKTFKAGGEFKQHLHSMNVFMVAAGTTLDDVLSEEEEVSHEPMDRERLAEIIQVADHMRSRRSVTRPGTPTEPPVIVEPEIIRGNEWGGWA